MSHSQAVSGSMDLALLKNKNWDMVLLLVTAAILGLGLVMVMSASIPIAEKRLGQSFFYFSRQAVFIVLGILASLVVSRIPMKYWQQAGPVMLLLGFILLVLVVLPGVGKQVNGSMRWLPLGFINLQVSEMVKLMMFIYLAGYLVRRGEEVRTTIRGFMKPMIVLSVAVVLLLLEPDFGAAAVMLATALGMMYMAGVGLFKFFTLLSVTAGAMALLALVSPYRLQRLLSFKNPWEDPYDSGFQLTQSLIAFGRGEWFGVGLGGSVQKLFYLPETHTDFLYAILAEELGLLGAMVVILLFAVLVWRAFLIGAHATREKQYFSAYLAYAIGIWIGLQAFINIGVNMGVLPTKGLTLPLMSYGGSSIVVTLVAIGMLMRIGNEAANPDQNQLWKKRKGVAK